MFSQNLIKKTSKLICGLAAMGFLTFGLTHGALAADEPAGKAVAPKAVTAPKAEAAAKAEAPKAAPAVKKSVKRSNYPGYLHKKDRKTEAAYRKLMRPALGYDFRLQPQAAKHHTSTW